jgi:hypothetical protein
MARVVLNLGSPKATAIPGQMNTGKHSSNTSAFTVKPLLKEKVEGKEKKAQKGLDNSDNIEGTYHWQNESDVESQTSSHC